VVLNGTEEGVANAYGIGAKMHILCWFFSAQVRLD